MTLTLLRSGSALQVLHTKDPVVVVEGTLEHSVRSRVRVDLEDLVVETPLPGR